MRLFFKLTLQSYDTHFAYEQAIVRGSQGTITVMIILVLYSAVAANMRILKGFNGILFTIKIRNNCLADVLIPDKTSIATSQNRQSLTQLTHRNGSFECSEVEYPPSQEEILQNR